jgi:hypothetical protein
MKHKNSHLLVGYWSRIRGGRDIPDQTDIDPRAIKRMLSHVFILEARDPARASYRLAGTWLCDRFGFELKGTSFLATWDVQSHNPLVLLMKQSLALKQPVCMSSIGSTSSCAMIEMETILAPLSFGRETPTRFLGIVQILGDAGAHLGNPISFQRLAGSKLIQEDERLPDSPPPSASPPVPPQPLRGHPKAPHLRLVISREKPVGVHFDMDEDMRKLIATLDITPVGKLSLLS